MPAAVHSRRFGTYQSRDLAGPPGPPRAPLRPHGFMRAVAELNRRRLMLMTGIGVLAAGTTVPAAKASVSGGRAPAGRGAGAPPPPRGAAPGGRPFSRGR